MDKNKLLKSLKNKDSSARELKYENAKAFLDDKKVVYRVSETHYQANCFLCNDTRYRLGIDIKTEQWHCFNCNSKGGSLRTLSYAYENKGIVSQKNIKEEYRRKNPGKVKNTNFSDFEKYHKLLFRTTKYAALKYLTDERMISQEATTYFKLGVRSVFKDNDGGTYEAGEHLAIPHLVDGKCVNLKYRAIDPGVEKSFKWRREKGGETVLYNHDVLYDLEYDEVIITEAELDCISVWCMGYQNVLGMTAGADAFQDLWYEQLNRFKKVYLLLDGDEAGQEGALKIAKRLGLDRCFNVTLPEDVKDANDFLKKYGRESFPTLLQGARQFEVPDVVSLSDGVNSLIDKILNGDKDKVVGLDTPWKKMNEKLGPVRSGHLVVINARPKAGKTSMVMNWVLYLANRGVSVGVYTCEMAVEDLVWKFMTATHPMTDYDMTKIDITEVKAAACVLPLKKVHFYYPQLGDLELEKVVDKMIEMTQRYGIKFFVFDNLHFLCRGPDEKALIDQATQAFKVLAVNLGITVCLITHPRKGGTKSLTNDDLKGSSSIFQDADSVILLNRKVTSEEEEGDSELELSTVRLNITARFRSGGRCVLAFDGSRGLFTESGFLYSQVIKNAKRNKGRKGKDE